MDVISWKSVFVSNMTLQEIPLSSNVSYRYEKLLSST